MIDFFWDRLFGTYRRANTNVRCWADETCVPDHFILRGINRAASGAGREFPTTTL